AAAKDLARAKNRLKSYLYFMGIHIPPHFVKQSKSWTRSYMNWLQELPLSPVSKQALQHLIDQGQKANESKKSVTRQLQGIGRDPKHAANMQWIRSVTGIGFVTGITFLLEMDDVHRFKT